MTKSDGGRRRIPSDSFRIRLAIVRTEQGWNYEEAQAATGIGAESWRQWEKGLRHCTDVIGVSKKIAEVTPYDQAWLALGGPLSTTEEEPLNGGPRSRRSKASTTGSITPVTRVSNRECMTMTRAKDARRAVNCDAVAA